jgi:hypothetical protein
VACRSYAHPRKARLQRHDGAVVPAHSASDTPTSAAMSR